MPEKVFYHVTLKRNLDSIMRNGLTPRIGALAASYGETIPAVYLFESREMAEDAIVNWLGDAFDDIFGEDAKEVILGVRIPSGVFVAHCEAEYERKCYQVIPPECLKVIL